MSNQHPRIARETKTVVAMINMYCKDNHGTRELCNECSELQDYAIKRLNDCPFQEGKTTCTRCPVHCYKSAMRERIRTVMRYSGPRMVYKHPVLALFHIIDSRRKKPIKYRKK
jgi:hypothetical protein